MTYTVLIDENSHYMDESSRRVFGEFARLDDAVAAAKSVVDRSLSEFDVTGRTADDLFDHYCQFGDDPFISGGDGPSGFSAREYARIRCRELTGMPWRDLASAGRYSEAEEAMLAETDRGFGYFPDNEIRGSFYENWGDTLNGPEQIEKYALAESNWRMFASCATSGGEGTARMLDVHRVAKKLESLTAPE